jgi:hypothetical protein
MAERKKPERTGGQRREPLAASRERLLELNKETLQDLADLEAEQAQGGYSSGGIPVGSYPASSGVT